jgi:hypothetical protein
LETSNLSFEDLDAAFGLSEDGLCPTGSIHCAEQIKTQLGVVLFGRSK